MRDSLNLLRSLHEIVDWQGLAVIEGGVGTGRVTRLYIDKVASSVCCDRSQHMLDFAKGILAVYDGKLKFLKADNTKMPDFGDKFDVFIEGWSFGHTASACSTVDEVPGVTDTLIHNATKDLRPGGVVILMETLGTNLDASAAPNERLERYYAELRIAHGFEYGKIRTDYRFKSNEEAARIMGFFFGEPMRRSVVERGTTISPEWTGVWTKTMRTPGRAQWTPGRAQWTR